MQFTIEQLKKIIDDHQIWLRDNSKGACAYLSGAYLSRASLSSADLSHANLSSAYLSSADLSSADLSSANLSHADLSSANLSHANLSGANLSSANLSRAYLSHANLSHANLSHANLSRANLSGANLSSADLSGADLSGAKLDDNTNLTGESWSKYLQEIVPNLLTAGGKTIQQIVDSGCWNCHKWENCPMHEAFGIDSSEDGPTLLIPRIKQFVQLFDANLIPCPVVLVASVQ